MMNKTAFTNLSSPNLQVQSQLGKSQQNTKSASSILTTSLLDKKGPWMSAWRDPLAKLSSFSTGMKLADVRGDGEIRLLIADHNQKFIIYKGTNIELEYNLIEIPIALEIFYSEISKNPIPSIAIACESAIYIYRNLKPYFKFVLPQIDISNEETDLWSKYYENQNLSELINNLIQLKEKSELSSKSMELLTLKSSNEQIEILNLYKNNLNIPNSPTCMGVIRNNNDDETGLSHLIIGSELNIIFILDNQGTAILRKISLPSTPVQICSFGTLAVDYLLFVSCRNDKIYIIKNGECEDKFIDIDSKLVGLLRMERLLYTAGMDQKVKVYNFKGIKIYSIKMSSDITNIEGLEFGKNKQIKGLLVALSSFELRLYKEKQLIYNLICDDFISGIKFGFFGREDGCLIILYKSKGIDVKILQRQFNFPSYLQKQGIIVDNNEDQPLNIPKKTKLFLEDTQRERDQAHEIHRNYQKDMIKMRLKAAQIYYNSLNSGLGSIQTNYQSNLRLHSNVSGLGPDFIIRVTLENVGNTAYRELFFEINFNPLIYRLTKTIKEIPFLIPRISYPIDIYLENIDQNGTNDNIKIFICKPDKELPLLGALIQMPLSELRI